MKKNYGSIIVFVLMCIIFTGMTAFAYSPDLQQAGSTPEPTGKDVLVVYFSATGTTKGVAEKIAAITDADLYEILAADDYSDADLNWHDRFHYNKHSLHKLQPGLFHYRLHMERLVLHLNQILL